MVSPQPLRLVPGDDLRAALEARAGCGFVVAGIGSLRAAMLRFAGAPQGERIEGPLEVLSLVGSFSAEGAHLHISLADAQGQVRGGHVCLGCEVLTTMELLLLPLPEGRLGRAWDAATGYAELLIRP